MDTYSERLDAVQLNYSIDDCAAEQRACCRWPPTADRSMAVPVNMPFGGVGPLPEPAFGRGRLADIEF